MQYRCYSCGLKLGDGIPPIEALSTNQAAAVGAVEDAPQRHDLLQGTKFEGMSTYSFCSFCLHMIQTAPDAFEGRQEMYDSVRHLPSKYNGTVENIYFNRLSLLLSGKATYKGMKWAVHEELLTEEFVQISCTTSWCDESIWSTDPMREYTCFKCSVHNLMPCEGCLNLSANRICYRCEEGLDTTQTLVRFGRFPDFDTCSCCNWEWAPSGDCGCSLDVCPYCSSTHGVEA